MLAGDALRIAVPSKGRLQDAALDLRRRAGLVFRASGRRLFSVCSDTNTGIIFSNVADMIAPRYSSPTVQRLQDERWLAVKVLVEKERIQSVFDELEKLGCVAILETEVQHVGL